MAKRREQFNKLSQDGEPRSFPKGFLAGHVKPSIRQLPGNPVRLTHFLVLLLGNSDFHFEYVASKLESHFIARSSLFQGVWCYVTIERLGKFPFNNT